MPDPMDAYLGESDDVEALGRDPGKPGSGAVTAQPDSRVESRPPDTQAGGLPQHILGGFHGVALDLDRRSRDWSMMVRLLDQQRMHLESAEAERERLYEAFEASLPAVLDSGRTLAAMMDRAKGGDVSGNLSAQFAENLRALDKLENLAQALTANLLWTRSSWEQYARSVIGANKMRDEIKMG